MEYQYQVHSNPLNTFSHFSYNSLHPFPSNGLEQRCPAEIISNFAFPQNPIFSYNQHQQGSATADQDAHCLPIPALSRAQTPSDDLHARLQQFYPFFQSQPSQDQQHPHEEELHAEQQQRRLSDCSDQTPQVQPLQPVLLVPSGDTHPLSSSSGAEEPILHLPFTPYEPHLPRVHLTPVGESGLVSTPQSPPVYEAYQHPQVEYHTPQPLLDHRFLSPFTTLSEQQHPQRPDLLRSHSAPEINFQPPTFVEVVQTQIQPQVKEESSVLLPVEPEPTNRWKAGRNLKREEDAAVTRTTKSRVAKASKQFEESRIRS
ncbi:hypothetical protein BT69DRAFT_1135458 [Atractiella rhizophila]|nr:hypothetical protein BT69DRAFT_1135458 [Atractiella rhizophila]